MNVYEGNEDYVFVSYAHKDSRRVLPAIAMLQSEGFRVWFDDGIETGSEWSEYIAGRLKGCRCFLVFLSRAANESPNCRREINYAIKLQKDTLVVYLEDCELSPGMQMQLDLLQALHRSKFPNEKSFLAAIGSARLLSPCRAVPAPPTGSGQPTGRGAGQKPRTGTSVENAGTPSGSYLPGTVYVCPGCGQRVRVQSVGVRIKITCPKCQTVFYSDDNRDASPGNQVGSSRGGEQYGQTGQKQQKKYRHVGGAVFGGFCLIVGVFLIAAAQETAGAGWLVIGIPLILSFCYSNGIIGKRYKNR